MKEVSIQFSKPEHGWIVSKISDSAKSAELTVSDVPCDSLAMLVESANRLFGGSRKESVEWSLEPEYANWDFQLTEETIELKAYDEASSKSHAFRENKTRLLRTIYNALKDIEPYFPSKEAPDDTQIWSWGFPSEGLVQLKQNIKKSEQSV